MTEHLTHLLPVSQLGGYQCHNVLRFKRLGNIGISTAIESLDLIFHHSLGSQEDDRNMRHLDVLPDFAAEVISRLARHHNV